MVASVRSGVNSSEDELEGRRVVCSRSTQSLPVCKARRPSKFTGKRERTGTRVPSPDFPDIGTCVWIFQFPPVHPWAAIWRVPARQPRDFNFLYRNGFSGLHSSECGEKNGRLCLIHIDKYKHDQTQNRDILTTSTTVSDKHESQNTANTKASLVREGRSAVTIRPSFQDDVTQSARAHRKMGIQPMEMRPPCVGYP